MKRFLPVAVLLASLRLCHASSELDGLAKKFRAVLAGQKWQIVKDTASITMIRTNVQFLNPMQLPPLDENELWEKYSFTSDFRITIRFDTKLAQSEYDRIVGLRDDLIAQRIAGLKRDSLEYWNVDSSAMGVLRLPDYYSERSSVYFYSSGADFFRLRPDSVKDARARIVAILEKSYKKYSPAQKAEGPTKPPALMDTAAFPADCQEAARAVAISVSQSGEDSKEFFATIERQKDGGVLVFHLWHSTAFDARNAGVVGNPGGKCRDVIYDMNSRKVIKTLFWQ